MHTHYRSIFSYQLVYPSRITMKSQGGRPGMFPQQAIPLKLDLFHLPVALYHVLLGYLARRAPLAS